MFTETLARPALPIVTVPSTDTVLFWIDTSPLPVAALPMMKAEPSMLSEPPLTASDPVPASPTVRLPPSDSSLPDSSVSVPMLVVAALRDAHDRHR